MNDAVFQSSNAEYDPLSLYKATAKGELIPPDNYKGIPIHAFRGLHTFVFEWLTDTLPMKDWHVADLGAGGGALTQRFLDHGSRVTSFDAVADNFQADNEDHFCVADLNLTFSAGYEQKFNLIAAIEIIEHLENPRKFIRNCNKMLKAGGYLLVSTPNVTAPYSLAEAIVKGTFHQFDDDYYNHGGHVTALPDAQLRHIFRENQFKVIGKKTFGEKQLKWTEWPKFYLAHLLVRWLCHAPTRDQGITSIYLLQRT